MNDKGTMSRLTTVNTLKQRLAGERQMLSPALIKDYLDKLADSYLLFTVPIRSYNTAIQAVNPKKVYAIDHAIAQAFSQATSDNAGLILENMVFIELKRSMKEIWYYKTEKGTRLISLLALIRISGCCRCVGPCKVRMVPESVNVKPCLMV